MLSLSLLEPGMTAVGAFNMPDRRLLGAAEVVVEMTSSERFGQQYTLMSNWTSYAAFG